MTTHTDCPKMIWIQTNHKDMYLRAEGLSQACIVSTISYPYLYVTEYNTTQPHQVSELECMGFIITIETKRNISQLQRYIQ